MEALKSSTVHRHLESKPRFLGMEAQDLVFLTLLASIMNLIFEKGKMGFVMTFLVPLGMGIILFFCKRGKPDNFLIHWIRYHITPGFFSSGQESQNLEEMRIKIYEN